MTQASVVRRPSVVRKLRFLGNRCIDLDQILWKAAYPPYLQTYFFSFFKILNFQIFTILFSLFVNMRPYGNQNFKMLVLPQIAPKFSETSPEFFSPIFLQSYFFGFLRFWILTGFVFVFVNIGPHGSQNCKTLLLPQIATKSFLQTFPDFLLPFQIFEKFYETLKFNMGVNGKA